MPVVSEVILALGEEIGPVLEDLATDLCVIERPTLVDDGKGGKRADWEATTAEPIACIAYPASGRTHLLGEVPKSTTVFSILVRGGVQVAGNYRVRLLARESLSERVVEVTHVLPQMGIVVEIVGTVSI